jgi:hypothetical protein
MKSMVVISHIGAFKSGVYVSLMPLVSLLYPHFREHIPFYERKSQLHFADRNRNEITCKQEIIHFSFCSFLDEMAEITNKHDTDFKTFLRNEKRLK